MPIPEDRFIKVGNINTRYWMSGEQGTPVVLIHGLGGSIENWVKNIDVLGQSHRVYAPDLMGFGQTDKQPVLRKVDELVQFLHDFMEVQKIEKAALIGNSLGGALALSFSVQFPDKVDRLVLADNAGMGREVNILFRLSSLPVLGQIMTRPSRRTVSMLWRKIVYDRLMVTTELVEKTYKLAALPGASKALLATIRAGINFRGQRTFVTSLLLDSATKVKVPTLIFWGQRDRIIPVAHAGIAVDLIPNSRLKIFDHCGHMPQLERPEEFNKLVLDFLA